jgi:hypothetical protein
MSTLLDLQATLARSALTVTYRALNQLKLDPRNMRQHPKRQIKLQKSRDLMHKMRVPRNVAAPPCTASSSTMSAIAWP